MSWPEIIGWGGWEFVWLAARGVGAFVFGYLAVVTFLYGVDMMGLIKGDRESKQPPIFSVGAMMMPLYALGAIVMSPVFIVCAVVGYGLVAFVLMVEAANDAVFVRAFTNNEPSRWILCVVCTIIAVGLGWWAVASAQSIFG